MIRDQNDDPNLGMIQELLKAQTIIPDFQPELRSEKIASTTLYAWPEAEKFPIGDLENAFLSGLYIVKQASVVPTHVKSRVSQALGVYGVKIAHMLDLANTKLAYVAMPEPEYALPEQRSLPVSDGYMTKESVFHFGMHAFKLDAAVRVKTARTLVAKMQQFELPVPPQLIKQAGYTMCDAGVLHDQLLARVAAASNVEDANRFQKIADFVVSNFPSNGLLTGQSELDSIFSALSVMDKQASVDRFYGRGLLAADQAVYNMSKRASDVVLIGDVPIDRETLSMLPPQTLRDIVGSDIVDEAMVDGELDVESFAQLMNTLPLPMRQSLTSALEGLV